MGLFDKALQKSEIKLFEPLIATLSKVSRDVEVTLADVPCSENSSFSHKGLGIRWNKGSELYLHRCRNVWMSCANSLGLNAAPFAMQFASTAEAAAYLSALINEVGHKGDVGGEHQSSSNQVETDETQNVENLKSEVEQAREARGEIAENLLDLMVRSGSPAMHAETKALELADEWFEGIAGELGDEPDEEIGTAWQERRDPTTNHGQKTLRDLETRLKFLRANRVSDSQIEDWWNQPSARRHFCMVQNLALLDSRMLDRFNQISEVENRTQMALLQAFCTVPIFSYESDYDLDLKNPLTPLPWEHFWMAMDFLLEQSKVNPRWEIEAIECRSFNRFFRINALNID